MAWFTAHLAFSHRIIDAGSGPVSAEESIFVFEAEHAAEALHLADREGLSRQRALFDQKLTVGDKPALEMFEGVRKLNPTNPENPDAALTEGTLLAHEAYEVADEEGLKDLIAGDEVFIHLSECPQLPK